MARADAESSAGIVLGFAASLLWAGSAIVSRFGVTTSFTPAEIIFLRSLAATALGGLVLGVAYSMRHPVVARLAPGKALFIVAVAGPFYHLLLAAGYKYVPASHGLAINTCLMVAFAVLIGAIRRKDVPDAITLTGMAAVLGGVALLLVDATSGGGPLNAGYAIFAVAALLWALYSHAVRDWSLDAVSVTLLLALSSPVYLLAYPWLEQSGFAAASWSDIWLQSVYHGVLVAFGATFFFTRSVRILGAPVASIFPACGPILTALLAMLLLSEPLTLWKVAGVATGSVGLLLVGVYGRAP